MPRVVGYHRPTSVTDALALLGEPGTAVLAGGTVLNASHQGDPVVAVDLQALGLGFIATLGAGWVRVGATTTLQQLADCVELPDTLRELARRELPSTLRTLATIGGTIGARDGSSALLAGLLVCDAVVAVEAASGPLDVSLASVLSDGVPTGALITGVSFDASGTLAAERTGRTPADTIVAAVARRPIEGALRLALAGVGRVPVLAADPFDAAALEPPSDFLGSAEYRRHVATVLADRARREVGA
jgi:CO/xanthine dehydrogenase FAD-binding subunit